MNKAREPTWYRDRILLALLLAALLLRGYLAATAGYIHDEDNTAIPLAESISFEPGSLHLPIRGENHGALPAYVVKASRTLFGTSRPASRALHVLLAVWTIGLVAGIARRSYGAPAAYLAAALMAFNEYHLSTSFRATAQAPHLFFVAAAVYAFSRFLASPRPAFLYLTAAMTGLAFYCKESSALLVIVFFATLAATRHRAWLRRPAPYVACLVYALVVAPDVAWNLRTNSDEARVSYGGQTLGQATYRAHLERVGGIGFSPYPLVFYARSAVLPIYRALTGRELAATLEYHALNPVLGAILLAAAVATTIRPGGAAVEPLLLILTWGIFGFFTLIEPGDPPFRLTPVNWVWVEATLVSTAVIAGARLARLTPKWRDIGWLGTATVLCYAVTTVLRTTETP